MKKLHRTVYGLLVLVALSACEKVKEKQVAALPETSVGDTLVLEPDSVEIDTAFAEGETSPYGEYEEDAWAPVEGATDGGEETAGTGQPGAGVTQNRESGGSTTTTTTRVASTEKTAPNAPAKPTAAVKKRYVRPTAAQLQRALGRDARLSSQMSLTRLKAYWLQRQHYYRRASKEVKYVAGPTKIKITPEETKIETAQGKVKIEGNDIKVKPE